MISKHDARQTLQDMLSIAKGVEDPLWDIRIGNAWTLKEIIGHLVDSASNNHQRFVRLQFGSLDQFPLYEAEPWVAAQHYADFDKEQLLNLWQSYNELIMHIAFRTPEDALKNVWNTQGKALHLDFLITDYFEHLREHIEHFKDRLAQVKAL